MNPLETFTRESLEKIRLETQNKYEQQNAEHYIKLFKSAFERRAKPGEGSDTYHNAQYITSTVKLMPRNIDILKQNGFDVYKIIIKFIPKGCVLATCYDSYYVCWDVPNFETLYKEILSLHALNMKIVSSDYVKL